MYLANAARTVCDATTSLQLDGNAASLADLLWIREIRQPFSLLPLWLLHRPIYCLQFPGVPDL